MKFISGIFLFCLSIQAFAQQDPVFTHYMYNTLAYNPAYAGSRQSISVTGINRNQWVGYDGAPVTQSFTICAPISKERIGIGMSVNNDKIGPLKNTGVYADFAYHIKLNSTSKLSMGLKAGVDMFTASLASVKLDDPNDYTFASNIQNQLTPNFGFGLYYYKSNFYAGLSVPRIIGTNIAGEKDGKPVSVIAESRHYYFTSGIVLKMNDHFDLNPTMLLKVAENAPTQIDLTASMVYKRVLSFGAMYRSGDAVGGLLNVRIQNVCMIGYSYDWALLNNTYHYHGGSHEVIVRYDLKLKKKSKGEFLGYF